ncbi:unnamed protein product, partial [Rotaria magnacalcarata]
MLSLMLVVLALIGCVHSRPIGFKSFEDYDTASLVPLIPAGEMLYPKENSSILRSNEKSTTTQTDQIVHYQPSTITQSISNSLSSQAHQLD